MDSRVLEGIGLTTGEAKVYLSLLGLGLSTTGPIADESGISASKVYKVLARLAKKGLVSHILKEKTKYFLAADPERLLDYLEAKEKRLKRERSEIEKILPSLKKRKASLEQGQSVEVFEGVEGIKTSRLKVLESLQKGDSTNILGGSKDSTGKFYGFWKQYQKMREKKGLKTRLLFDRTTPKKWVKEFGSPKLNQAKYLPSDIVTPSWFMTAGPFVHIGVPSEKPISILIKNRDIADSFSQYFSGLWNRTWSYFEGEEGIRHYFEDGLASLKKGQTWHVINSARPEPRFEKLIREYHKERFEKGINLKITFSKGMSDLVASRFQSGLSQVRILPKIFATPAAISVYANRLVIVLWTKNPRVFMVRDKELNRAFKKYFDILWSIATPAKRPKKK